VSCIRHFRTELRFKVDAIESELNQLALRIARGEAASEQLVRTHLERLSRQLARKRPVRTAAESVLKLSGNDVEATAANGPQQSRCVHFQELSEQVTRARNRACAAMDVAAAAIDEAAHAALEAWLAEKDAARAGTADSQKRAEAKQGEWAHGKPAHDHAPE
jgi:hypothetical protein